jgi:transcriptional regulator with XRE-family HTH domain
MVRFQAFVNCDRPTGFKRVTFSGSHARKPHGLRGQRGHRGRQIRSFGDRGRRQTAGFSPLHKGPHIRLCIARYTIVYTDKVTPKLQSSPTVAGSLLLSARLKAGLTQQEFADRLGISQSAVAAYESGRRQPTIPTLMRWLSATGFDLRLTLVPHEDHDSVLESLERLRSPDEQERWSLYQRRRVQAAREGLEQAR